MILPFINKEQLPKKEKIILYTENRDEYALPPLLLHNKIPISITSQEFATIHKLEDQFLRRKPSANK